MHSTFVAGFVVAGVLLAADARDSAFNQAPLTVKQAIDSYASGDFGRAVGNLSTPRLTVTQFTTALDEWIAAGEEPSLRRRKTVAVAFALDAVWSATRTAVNANRANADPWKKVTPDHPDKVVIASFVSQALVAQWVAGQLPTTGTPDALERLLWLTTVGVVEDSHAWHRLRHEVLPLARNRLPGDPRLELAGVLADTNIELGPLRLSSVLRNDVLRVEKLPSAITGRIPKAIRAFEPLRANPALSGEVELRIGYLELRRDKWPEAINRFASAYSLVEEPALRVAADYFAGWVHEQLGQPVEAIAAYRRADATAPAIRNLATRFAALLFLHNKRAEAYAVLDPALNARTAPLDPLMAVERADARFVPEWITSIRRLLQ